MAEMLGGQGDGRRRPALKTIFGYQTGQNLFGGIGAAAHRMHDRLLQAQPAAGSGQLHGMDGV
ncbi:MAG: hypothetical protein BWY71_01818 [Planctomycetes bacterium ADurb.Bin412]|nr:MAG: hypothetical protein BWY71_01818 [Planctomycetes bacterium ADurb.Bin412]